MKLVQKLTAKTLGWSRNEIENAIKEVKPTDEVCIGRVAGIVTGIRKTLDDKGEIQFGLKGQFKGLSSKDVSTPIVAGVCYLPSGVQAMIEGSFAKAQEENPSATIRFAMDLYVFADSNKAGYSFRGESLMEMEGTDIVDDLLSSANESVPLLTDMTASKKGK